MTRFIETHRERFGGEPICRELQVAPSTYYAARQRPRSARRIRDEALQVKLRQVHAEHFGSTAHASSGASSRARASWSLAAPWSG